MAPATDDYSPPVIRVGWGFDVHRFGGRGPIRLCGVEVAAEQGLVGTSDADVALHAVIDSMLGAAALGDIGELFPPSDPTWSGADSRDLLVEARSALEDAGFRVQTVDVTIIAEDLRVAPHRDEMRRVLAAALGLALSAVSVKGTSTDGLGSVGRGEGIASAAVTSVVQE